MVRTSFSAWDRSPKMTFFSVMLPKVMKGFCSKTALVLEPLLRFTTPTIAAQSSPKDSASHRFAFWGPASSSPSSILWYIALQNVLFRAKIDLVRGVLFVFAPCEGQSSFFK